MRKNLLVSFSGGETSAFMAQWIKKHLEDSYDKVVYVFANTGLENEETLEFVQKCDDYWKLNVQWVECSINPEKGGRKLSLARLLPPRNCRYRNSCLKRSNWLY